MKTSRAQYFVHLHKFTTCATLGLGLAAACAQTAPPAATSHATATTLAGTTSAVPTEDVHATYRRDVLPIFMGKCARCHNQQSVLYNWLDYKTAYSDRLEIKRRVWDSWKGRYYKQTMPAGNGPECQAMTEEERLAIKDWVETGGAQGQPASKGGPKLKAERLALGEHLFKTICAACHQPNGQGLPGKFPPLAASDFLNADKNRAIRILLNGRQGQIVVNGVGFNNSMPMFPLQDEDIANALTYVYGSFGNSGKVVTPGEVAALRGQKDVDDEAPAKASNLVHSPAEDNPYE